MQILLDKLGIERINVKTMQALLAEIFLNCGRVKATLQLNMFFVVDSNKYLSIE